MLGFPHIRRCRGFSLIELMVTLTVAGTLATIAAPSFRTMILNNRMTSITNDFVADVAAARSEAAKRGMRITICINSTGGGANTACVASGAGVGSLAGWEQGWIMFADTNGNGAIDAGDTILRVKQALPRGYTVGALGGYPGYIQVRPSGFVNFSGTVWLCDGRGVGYPGKKIGIAITGRTSINPVGWGCLS